MDSFDETHLLSCNLQCYDLSSCPTYTALSYEWGEVEPQVDIIVNGRLLLIRHNLRLFLGAIRARQRCGVLAKDLQLWIDAICIDQEDLSERNAQVSIMGTIYRKAVSVIAWLGVPQGWDPKSTFAFIKADSWDLCARDRSRKCWGLIYSESIDRVLKMCQCRYWSRRWVVQEVMLARDVTLMCGEHDLSWLILHSFILRLADSYPLHQSQTIRTLNDTIPFIMSRHKYGGVCDKGLAPSIRQLLTDFRATDCENSLDKVYSLLGLASDGNTIPIDYGSSPLQLLWRVLANDRWSRIEELQFLAECLGVSEFFPTKFRQGDARIELVKTPASQMCENFVLTHRILFCSSPLSRTELNVQKWAESMNPGQELTELYQILKDSNRDDLLALEQGSSYESDDEECDDEDFDSVHRTQQKCDKKNQESVDLEGVFAAGGSRLFICDDGSMGITCSDARAGDLLCDFILGKRGVLREDHENGMCLIGTAVLRKSHPKLDVMLSQVGELSEMASQEEQYHNFLQLDCSTDGSTIADVLVNVERNLFVSIAQDTSSLVSSLEAERRTLLRYIHGVDGFKKRTIWASCNTWDLIALARM